MKRVRFFYDGKIFIISLNLLFHSFFKQIIRSFFSKFIYLFFFSDISIFDKKNKNKSEMCE